MSTLHTISGVKANLVSFDVEMATSLGVEAAVVYAIISDEEKISTKELHELINYIPQHRVVIGLNSLKKEGIVKEVSGKWEVV